MAQRYTVKHGGLMRCCLASLDDAMRVAAQAPNEGDTVKCQYCSDEFGMVFRDGAWQWAAPPLAAIDKANAEAR